MGSKGLAAIFLLALVPMLGAAPALAQTAEEAPNASGAMAQEIGGPPNPAVPEYQLQGDQLIIEGDVGVHCPSATRAFERHGNGSPRDAPDTSQWKFVVEYANLCYQYGFPTPGRGDGDDASAAEAVLPETGGAGAVPLLAGLLSAGLGLIVLRMVRQGNGSG